jgi:hypothetical protein
MKRRYLECNCLAPEHLLRFYWWEDEDRDNPEWGYLCVETNLSHYLPWYKRIWHAIKYIFGSPCGWGETLIYKENAKELKSIIEDYLKEGEYNEND